MAEHVTQIIPEGYKNTEVGVIPKDWDIYKIQKLIEDNYILSHLDGNHGNLYPRSHEFREAGIPYIGANDFSKGEVCFSRCKFLSEERARQFEKGVAKNGDVLFAHNATVGPVALLKTNLDYIILSTTATYFRCDNKRLLNIYLLYALQSPFFVKQYQAVMAQSTRFQVPITIQRKFNLVLPKEAEQAAVAKVLYDTDALITALEKLIAKKCAIKQGAMQELLTGKRRLPGFSGKWETMKLGEIAEIYQPVTISQAHFVDDGYLVYGANGIVGKYGKYNHETWQTIITCRGSTCGTVNKTVNKCWVTGNAMVVNIDKNISLDKLFFYYLLTQQDFNNCVTGTGQPQIVRTPLALFEVRLPKNKCEQIAIAGVLSDIDEHIEMLKQKLAKYKILKQGMMQVLLIGEVRLI